MRRWQVLKSSRHEVATIQLEGGSGDEEGSGVIGAGGSYFRSLSQDYYPPEWPDQQQQQQEQAAPTSTHLLPAALRVVTTSSSSVEPEPPSETYSVSSSVSTAPPPRPLEDLWDPPEETPRASEAGWSSVDTLSPPAEVTKVPPVISTKQQVPTQHQYKVPTKLSPMASTSSLISSQINISSRGVKSRCTWLPGVAAMLVALSAAVSLGNVLRLPRLVLLHGSGPFLVAYLVALVVLGLPLMFLEVGLGQFCQQGSLQIYRAVPLLKGVGLVKLGMGVLLCAYYPVTMAASLFSLVWSAKGPIPFSECKHLYGSFNYALGVSLASSSKIVVGEQCLKESVLKPPEQDAMWLGVNYALLFLLWGFLLLSQWGGTAWYRRAVVITGCLSLAALITVLAHAASNSTLDWPLDWANWSVLMEPKVWYFAIVQVFFSTQIGFGTNITNAGKLFPKKNAFWVSLSVIVVNGLVGVGAVWASWLWLRQGSLEEPSRLASQLPEVLVLSLVIDFASMDVNKWLTQLWACFACLALVLAGFVSTANLLYTLITAVASEKPAEKIRRWYIVLAFCIMGFVAGVLCFVPSHFQFVHLLDHYVIGRLVVATTILELIGFAWIYGCNTLYNDFEFVLGQKLNVMWKVLWSSIPLLLLGVELWSIISLPLDGLPHQRAARQRDPDWITITGWTMYLAMWLLVFGAALWALGQQVDYNFSDKLRSAIKPSSKWGPADPLHRHGWVRWRTQYSTTGRKDFTLRRRGTRDYTHSARVSPATTLGRPGSTLKNGQQPSSAVSPLAAGVASNPTLMPWQSSPTP